VSERLLDVKEAAIFLGVHYDTVRGFIKQGRLPAIRYGKRRYKLRECDLKAFIQASIIGPAVGPVPRLKRTELARFDRGQKSPKAAPNAWRQEFRGK
jgi:excisionase family DNA binding protein